ncbi:PIN domain-containing protein [Candidatus Woesearchaeota archaeon]|nr:PIN domain-containing protein [Candidatus Woesearchaeota archaeon]
MILDTTVIIDLLKNDLPLIEKIKIFNKKEIPLFFTSVSVFELWQGAEDISDKLKLEKIHSLLDSFGSFNLDVPSSKEAGSIHSELRKKGQVIDAADSMIAGIAKINNETILTRNIKHFSRISGLKVESY